MPEKNQKPLWQASSVVNTAKVEFFNLSSAIRVTVTMNLDSSVLQALSAIKNLYQYPI